MGLIEVTVRGLSDSVKHWVLDLSQSPFIDETAIQALEDAVRTLKHRGIKTTLVSANDLVLRKLTAHGTLTLLGEDGYVSTLTAVKPVV